MLARDFEPGFLVDHFVKVIVVPKYHPYKLSTLSQNDVDIIANTVV